MKSDQSMAKLLAFLRREADANGLVKDISQDEMGKRVGLAGRRAWHALALLIKTGAITIVTRGTGGRPSVYRVGIPAPEPVREYKPSGIESVVRHIPNHNWLGAAGTAPTIEISLPRVRFLERTRA